VLEQAPARTCGPMERGAHAAAGLLAGLGGGGRETGVKLSPERREGLEGGVLRSGFISHYPTLI